MPRYRSRAIWDEARKQDAPCSAYIRAILYELQPIRFSTLKLDEMLYKVKKFLSQLLKLFVCLFENLAKRKWSFNEIKSIIILILYVYGVLYLHRLFDAGPVIVISTALIIIFTIGLSDNPNGDAVSAYSVFNRGFRQLLGSIDAEELVNQYVGGALALQQPQRNEDNDENVPLEHHMDQNQHLRQQPEPRQNGETSRKSGKKARRRNLEQRREAQMQRQLAREMGFENNEEGVMMMNAALHHMNEE